MKSNRMNIPLILVLLFAIFIMASCSSLKMVRRDLPSQTWERSFGGAGEDAARSVTQLPGGDYIIAGKTTSFKAVDNDIYILRVDPLGNLVWQRNYGGGGADDAAQVINVSGGLIVVGSSSSTRTGQRDIYLMKIKSDGQLVWDKLLGGNDYEDGSGVVELPDGGLAVIGTTKSYGAGSSDIYLIRLNSEGETLWEKTYGGPYLDHGSALALTPDNGFLILGWTKSYGEGREDFYLIRTDSTGRIIWQRTYGGPYIDYAMALTVAPGNTSAFTGRTNSEKTETQVPCLYSLDTLGHTVWQKTYTGFGDGGGNSIIATPNGSYILTGWVTAEDARGQVFLARIAGNGSLVWKKLFGGRGEDTGWSVIPTLDGGYLIAGRTTTFSNSNGDVYLLKTDSDGNLGTKKPDGATQEPSGR